MERMQTARSSRSHYDRKLVDLKEQIKDLSTICRQMLQNIERILTRKSEESACGFSEAAEEAMTRVRTIDRICTLLILKEQPVSRDLRLITRCGRVSLDLGRIAHLCLDLSKTLERIRTDDFLDDLLKMCSLTQEQFSIAVQEIMTFSGQKNSEIERLDDQIDLLYEKIKNQLIRENTQNDQAVELLMAAKYLERIADHSVMISENLITPL